MTALRKLLLPALLGLALAAAGPAGAQDADTPLDKAIQKVQARLGELRAKPDADPASLKFLEELLGNLQEEKQRQRTTAGAGGEAGGGGGPPGGRGGAQGAESWFRGRVLEGVDLEQEERTTAERLLKEFGADWGLANSHQDEGSKRVITDDLGDRLERQIPKKKAMQIMINVRNILKWPGGRGR